MDERQPVEFLLQLRVAQQKAQRRTQIVQLRGGHTLHLGISGGIEPGIFAIEQKNLAWRIGIAPVHLARLAQQQSPALFAIDAHSMKALGEGGAQRMEAVVVLIDALRHLLRGGFRLGERSESAATKSSSKEAAGAY